jgi:hypothetical protein
MIEASDCRLWLEFSGVVVTFGYLFGARAVRAEVARAQKRLKE